MTAAHRPVVAAAVLAISASALLYATRDRWGQRLRRPGALPPRPAAVRLRSVPPHLKGWEPLLGRYAFNATTRSPLAQELFEIGLQLLYNFDQPNARAAFLSAQAADSSCAMCAWGVAHSHGPFLNAPTKSAEELALARAAASNASALLNTSRWQHSWKEQVLIDAMAVRYADDPAQQLLGYRQYASRLRALRLSRRCSSDDPDLLAFDAESLMVLLCDDVGYHFFEYRGDSDPPAAAPGTREALALLRAALRATNQTHPYAQHLLIHGTEMSNAEAVAAVPVARQLVRDMRGLQDQHLQHMASHTLFRAGLYHEALLANVVATGSDHAYFRHGLVPYGPGHNANFLVSAALWGGERAPAHKYAAVMQDIFRRAPDRSDSPGPDAAWSAPMVVALRFGDWSQVGRLDAPPPEGFSTAWPYGAGVLRSFALSAASARLGQRAEAAEHLKELRRLAGEVAAAGGALVVNWTAIANFTAEAVLANAGGDASAAVDAMQRAVDVEMGMTTYLAPSRWMLPPRECLGQALLNAGRAREAEAVFQKLLRGLSFHAEPSCGWALFGLRESLRRQPPTPAREREIADLTAQIADAWRHSDVSLTSACLLLEG